MAELTVNIYSHNFQVTEISARCAEHVARFARKYVQWGMVREDRRWVRTPVKVFAAAFRDRSAYRFHIHQLDDFKMHMKLAGVYEDQITWNTVPLQPLKLVDLPIQDGWALRENQQPASAYLVKDEGSPIRFLALQTGQGKSFTTMYSAAVARAIACYLFRPAYLEKWIIDFRKTYDLKKGDLITAQGSEELKGLLEMAKRGELHAKIIAISNKTFQNYLKLYEEFKDDILTMGYACTPPQFFEFLNCAWRVIDEVHLDFHLNFKIDLYTHVHRSVSLSATMFSDDDFVTKMHNLAYPPTLRYDDGSYKKYVDVEVVTYNLANPHRVKHVDFASGRYSHNVLEHSIMKQAPTLDNYIALIKSRLDAKYVQQRKDGDRALIFCASIDFCTLLVERLRKLYPNFRIERYVGSLNDPYENLITPDIAVSTHGSSGTATDVPQLTYVLMTVSMRSSPGSLQNLGRLRMLPDGRTPCYTFLTCLDIVKHLDYHAHRLKLLENRAANIRVDYSRMVV